MQSSDNKLILTDKIKEEVCDFWLKFTENWNELNEMLFYANELQCSKVLDYCYFISSKTMKDYLDYEITIGEVNRMECKENPKLVELYISPKLNINNVKLMEYMVSKAPKLKNLAVIKYRAYNSKDALIDSIQYKDFTAKYEDFGCQHFISISAETKQPLVNLVIFVHKPLADLILEKRKVTIVDPDIPDSKPFVIEKWLTTNLDILYCYLLNVVGEYNLIHNTGYIEFLPEGDPLISEGSVFTELNDLKAAYDLLEGNLISKCQTCCRKKHQCRLLRCSKCKLVLYCSIECQKTDFETHKLFCKLAN
jgi:hypothetical protein